jgi:hypothetical protein
VNLFYITGNADIAQANLTCPLTSISCTLQFNGIITTDSTYPVHALSGLSAAYLGGTYSWRVYYHNTDGTLSELDGDAAASTGWTSRIVGGKAKIGSNIAVSLANSSSSPGINVFYVDEATALLTTVTWYGGWSSRKSPLSSLKF